MDELKKRPSVDSFDPEFKCAATPAEMRATVTHEELTIDSLSTKRNIATPIDAKLLTSDMMKFAFIETLLLQFQLSSNNQQCRTFRLVAQHLLNISNFGFQ